MREGSWCFAWLLQAFCSVLAIMGRAWDSDCLWKTRRQALWFSTSPELRHQDRVPEWLARSGKGPAAWGQGRRACGSRFFREPCSSAYFFCRDLAADLMLCGLSSLDRFVSACRLQGPSRNAAWRASPSDVLASGDRAFLERDRASLAAGHDCLDRGRRWAGALMQRQPSCPAAFRRPRQARPRKRERRKVRDRQQFLASQDSIPQFSTELRSFATRHGL